MEFGRCIQFNLGYIGCSSDVLDIADMSCSGRRRCEIGVPSEHLDSVKPCLSELKSYLTASYRCQKGSAKVANKFSANCNIASYRKPKTICKSLSWNCWYLFLWTSLWSEFFRSPSTDSDVHWQITAWRFMSLGWKLSFWKSDGECEMSVKSYLETEDAIEQDTRCRFNGSHSCHHNPHCTIWTILASEGHRSITSASARKLQPDEIVI